MLIQQQQALNCLTNQARAKRRQQERHLDKFVVRVSRGWGARWCRLWWVANSWCTEKYQRFSGRTHQSCVSQAERAMQRGPAIKHIVMPSASACCPRYAQLWREQRPNRMAARVTLCNKICHLVNGHVRQAHHWHVRWKQDSHKCSSRQSLQHGWAVYVALFGKRIWMCQLVAWIQIPFQCSCVCSWKMYKSWWAQWGFLTQLRQVIYHIFFKCPELMWVSVHGTSDSCVALLWLIPFV